MLIMPKKSEKLGKKHEFGGRHTGLFLVSEMQDLTIRVFFGSLKEINGLNFDQYQKKRKKKAKMMYPAAANHKQYVVCERFQNPQFTCFSALLSKSTA